MDEALIGEIAREASHLITNEFNRTFAVVYLPPNIDLEQFLEGEFLLLNTVKKPLVCEGRPPSVKEVRKYLWDMRKSRQLRRGRWVLWGWWDEAKETAFLGLAEKVVKQVGKKMAKRNRGFLPLQVE